MQKSLAWQNGNQVQSVVLEEHNLRINGTSNVNDFECIYDEELEEKFEGDTLSSFVEVEEAIAEVEGDRLILEIDSFDCGKRGINRDFRNTLKSKIYPNIQIELLNVVQRDGSPVQAEVSITLAGVTQQYEVNLFDANLENEETTVSGSQVIRMSDFDLKPPKALFGLIKVRDEITINFSLRIRTGT